MKLFFSEKQYFRSVWLLLLFVPLNLLFLYGIYHQIIMGKPWGTNPMSDIGLFMIEGFIFLFSLWFWNVKLITKVYEDRIYIMFSMLWFKHRVVRYDEIKTSELRKYNGLKEYGGWGDRGRKHNKAYTTSGEYGVQIVLHNEKRILIGSQKPQALFKAISRLTSDKQN